jgi:hypothetical protein
MVAVWRGNESDGVEDGEVGRPTMPTADEDDKAVPAGGGGGRTMR